MSDKEMSIDGFDDDECYELITMLDDDGNEKEFYLIDSVTKGEYNYLLVIDGDEENEDESDAFIFKETIDEGETSIYEIVEDEEEFNAIVKLFQGSDDFEIKL